MLSTITALRIETNGMQPATHRVQHAAHGRRYAVKHAACVMQQVCTQPAACVKNAHNMQQITGIMRHAVHVVPH